jgi:glycosyltransferase involved in cell wall biosynthesis
VDDKMIKDMRVSIIIPVYKVEDYIEKCLLSVFMQRYGNLEVILVDDASPDNSINVAKEVISQLNNPQVDVVYVTHEVNRGLSAARNSGIDVATGDYVYFIDSDDELYDENSMLTLVDSAIETNADIVVGNHYVHRSENPYFAKYSEPKLLKDGDLISAFVKGDVPVMAWNKLIRKSVLEKGLRFKEGILNEDELFSYQILFTNPTIYLTGCTTYRYNYREGSIMHSFNIKRIESPIIVYEEASQLYNQINGSNPLVLKNLDHFAFKRYADILKSAADEDTKRSLYRRLRNAQRKLKGVGMMRYVYNSHIYLPEFLGYAMMRIVGKHYIKSRNLS